MVVVGTPGSFASAPEAVMLASADVSATKRDVLPRRPVASFIAGASNGYFAGVWGTRNRVTLSVLDRNWESAATYEVRGRVAGGTLRARFGSLGRIAVEFRPSGKVTYHRPPKRCVGPVRRTIYGNFVGTIRFRGEQGYTRFNQRGAEGALETAGRWRCNDASSSVDQEGAAMHTVLAAFAAVRLGKLSFRAGTLRSPGKRGLTAFRATSSEQRGRMKIKRSATVFGADRSFVFDEGLNLAVVSPPRPFSGSATYVRNPDGTSSWRGRLRVDFPGAKNRSLANDSFSTRLTQR